MNGESHLDQEISFHRNGEALTSVGVFLFLGLPLRRIPPFARVTFDGRFTPLRRQNRGEIRNSTVFSSISRHLVANRQWRKNTLLRTKNFYLYQFISSEKICFWRDLRRRIQDKIEAAKFLPGLNTRK